GKRFSVNGDSIVFPLLGIKNIGRALIDKIRRSHQEDGDFKSFWDFCKRVSGSELNRRALECLIKGGALDGLDLNRNEMLHNLDLAVECAAKESQLYAGGQLNMFASFGDESFSSAPVFGRFEEMSKTDILNNEKEVAGLYFTGHPLDEYRGVSEALKCPKTSTLYELLETGAENEIDNKKIKFLGVINSIKKKVTKRDDIMAFCGVEDLFGELEMIVFPKVLAQFNDFLVPNKVVLVEGRLSVKDDEIKLLAESVAAAPEGVETVSVEAAAPAPKSSKGKKGVFLRITQGNESLVDNVKNLLSIFEGDMPVYVYYESTKQYEFLGREYTINVNEPLVKELKYILGDENVVVRQ
ncbi:MAG: hypothetical protein IKV44_01240, partial [Clostridia bacterium]|nr:hypothetical protein [Clostridia bacterium]